MEPRKAPAGIDEDEATMEALAAEKLRQNIFGIWVPEPETGTVHL